MEKECYDTGFDDFIIKRNTIQILRIQIKQIRSKLNDINKILNDLKRLE